MKREILEEIVDCLPEIIGILFGMFAVLCVSYYYRGIKGIIISVVILFIGITLIFRHKLLQLWLRK